MSEYKERKSCTVCGARYTANSASAKYCKSCRKTNPNVSINSIRLLNFALGKLNLSREELIAQFKEEMSIGT